VGGGDNLLIKFAGYLAWQYGPWGHASGKYQIARFNQTTQCF